MTFEGAHVIYPEGPTCSAHCPGPWSQFHDGYADGYERALNERDRDMAELMSALAAAVRAADNLVVGKTKAPIPEIEAARALIARLTVEPVHEPLLPDAEVKGTRADRDALSTD